MSGFVRRGLKLVIGMVGEASVEEALSKVGRESPGHRLCNALDRRRLEVVNVVGAPTGSWERGVGTVMVQAQAV